MGIEERFESHANYYTYLEQLPDDKARIKEVTSLDYDEVDDLLGRKCPGLVVKLISDSIQCSLDDIALCKDAKMKILLVRNKLDEALGLLWEEGDLRNEDERYYIGLIDFLFGNVDQSRTYFDQALQAGEFRACSHLANIHLINEDSNAVGYYLRTGALNGDYASIRGLHNLKFSFYFAFDECDLDELETWQIDQFLASKFVDDVDPKNVNRLKEVAEKRGSTKYKFLLASDLVKKREFDKAIDIYKELIAQGYQSANNYLAYLYCDLATEPGVESFICLEDALFYFRQAYGHGYTLESGMLDACLSSGGNSDSLVEDLSILEIETKGKLYLNFANLCGDSVIKRNLVVRAFDEDWANSWMDEEDFDLALSIVEAYNYPWVTLATMNERGHTILDYDPMVC